MKTVAWVLGALLTPVLAIAAIEEQWVGHATSVLGSGTPRSTSASGGLKDPAEVVSAAFDQESGSLTLLAAGDIADCPQKGGLAGSFPETAHLLGLPSTYELTDVAASHTADLAQSWPGTPILALGDLVYRSGTPAEFAECYHPIWGGLRDRTLPAPGNHEYGSPAASGYFGYWSDRAGPDRRGYYSAAAGNWLILSLNSEAEAGPDSEQGRWLQETLERAPQTCVLAFYHRPAYSLRDRDGRENATRLFGQLQRSGATVVLNGHNHFYERTAPLAANGTVDDVGGTIAFTVGTGGQTSDEKPRLDTTEAAVFGAVGLLRLELAETGFRWWYHEAVSRKIADSGEAQCNPARSPKPMPL